MCLKHHILELEQDTINKHIKAYWYIVNLEYGYYSFVETKAPKGFELDDSRYEFRIDDDGEDGVPETIDGDTIIAVHEETPENDPLCDGRDPLPDQGALLGQGAGGGLQPQAFVTERDGDRGQRAGDEQQRR